MEGSPYVGYMCADQFPMIALMICMSDTLTFEGIVNFRDIGGCTTADGSRVRTGSIFRSATLSLASP